MTEQEMFELAVDLYIAVTSGQGIFSDQAEAHVLKVKEELSAQGQWEQFAARVMQGMQGDDFNHRVRTEAAQRMVDNPTV
jgi:hypothetical protein